MTSQRDETASGPAGEDMTDDPIVIERRDEILTGGVPADEGLGEDGTAGDELVGRSAAPDTGGADPAPLVVPSGEAGSDVAGPDLPSSDLAGPAALAQPGVTGEQDPGVTTSPGAGDRNPRAGAAGGGIPAAALSEQQWPAIQAMFVDDPKGSVLRAAAAADEVAKALTASLQREQAALRATWENDASTEDLRTALQQYRAFCGRLEGLA